jgi:hypothetical protein
MAREGAKISATCQGGKAEPPDIPNPESRGRHKPTVKYQPAFPNLEDLYGIVDVFLEVQEHKEEMGADQRGHQDREGDIDDLVQIDPFPHGLPPRQKTPPQCRGRS